MALLSDDICVIILLRSTNRLSSVEVCDFAIHEKAGTRRCSYVQNIESLAKGKSKKIQTHIIRLMALKVSEAILRSNKTVMTSIYETAEKSPQQDHDDSFNN
jgi:hypothetical protein